MKICRLRARGHAALLCLSVILVGGLGAAAPAYAATTYTVSTTADIAANAGACGNTGITVAPSPLSLREATCIANNLGGAVTINIPAGRYTLGNGELQPGKNVGRRTQLVGAGAASTIIDASGHSRVLDFDAELVGGVTTSHLGRDDHRRG